MSVYRDIASLKIQGANEVALAVLKYLKKFCKRHGFEKEFEKEVNKFLSLRSTAVVLYNVIDELKKERTIEKLDELIGRIKNNRKLIVENGLKVFKKRNVVMTHCHSGVVTKLLISAFEHGKNVEVYVTETRPNEQGIITAKELASANVHVKFIVDSAAGYYLPTIDFVLVGADALRKEGVVNKIGTLLLAMATNEFNKPLYVCASTMKLDLRKKLVIEMRNPKEVYKGLRGVDVLDPIFDVTPWKYVSGVITEKGILKPKEIIMMLR